MRMSIVSMGSHPTKSHLLRRYVVDNFLHNLNEANLYGFLFCQTMNLENQLIDIFLKFSSFLF